MRKDARREGNDVRARRSNLVTALALALSVASTVDAGVYFAEPVKFGENNGLIDGAIHVATDRHGTWLAVWSRGPSLQEPFEIVSITSTDAGQTWSAPQSVVVTEGKLGSGGTFGLVSTGPDSFVLGWHDDAVGTFVSHSGDGGASWSTPRSVPVPLKEFGVIEVRSIQLAGDPAGGTVLVGYMSWEPNLCDVKLLRSVDDGLTWGAPVTLGAPDPQTTGSFCPVFDVATDGGGGWMAAWKSGGDPGDIYHSYSGDDGVSWSLASAVYAGSGFDVSPAVASDGAGRWLVLFQSNETFGGTLPSGWRVFASHSDDNGMTWSPVAAINPLAATEDDDRLGVALLVAGDGDTWVFEGRQADTAEYLGSRSIDGGITWTVPSRWHGSILPGDETSEAVGTLATDAAGNWITGWQTNGGGVDPWVSLSLGTTLCTAPLAGCKGGVVPGASKLVLSDRKPGRPSAKWKWKKGEATMAEEFGDPLTSGAFRVCMYDASGRALLGGRVPAGGTCGGQPCWRSVASGFSYKTTQPGLAPHGLIKLRVKAGDDGKAQVVLGGRGPSLPMPALRGVELPLRIQLDSLETAACWETVVSTAIIATPQTFKAKSD
jgi:hypothetical protein